MRALPPALILFLAATTAPSQTEPQPRLHADEVAGVRLLQRWIAESAHLPMRVEGQSTAAGYEAAALVDDGASGRLVELVPHDRTVAFVLWPRDDAVGERRLLFGNRGGRMFLGTAPPRPRDWRPRAATIVGTGGREHVNDMLLQSGTSLDGTQWERFELATTPQAVAVTEAGGRPLAGVSVDLGAGRLPWHPGWLPLANDAAGALAGTTGDDGMLRGDGIRARGLRLSLRRGDAQALLEPDMVRVEAGTLRVRVPATAWVPEKELTDRAWTAEALLRFAAAQHAFRARGALDRDRDGRGEFGWPLHVLPKGDQRFERIEGTHAQFRGHWFACWLETPDGLVASLDGTGTEPGADAAELRFVAVAWPARAGAPGALQFRVDERGVVEAKPAGDAIGSRAPPVVTAGDAGAWRAVRTR